MDFWEVIYENVKKKQKTFISQHTSIYKVPRHFEVL